MSLWFFFSPLKNVFLPHLLGLSFSVFSLPCYPEPSIRRATRVVAHPPPDSNLFFAIIFFFYVRLCSCTFITRSEALGPPPSFHSPLSFPGPLSPPSCTFFPLLPEVLFFLCFIRTNHFFFSSLTPCSHPTYRRFFFFLHELPFFLCLTPPARCGSIVYTGLNFLITARDKTARPRFFVPHPLPVKVSFSCCRSTSLSGGSL